MGRVILWLEAQIFLFKEVCSGKLAPSHPPLGLSKLVEDEAIVRLTPGEEIKPATLLIDPVL